MSRRPAAAALAVGLLVAAGPALAAPPNGAAMRGRELALVVCTPCHVVATDQEFEPAITQKTPSFQEIADDPTNTAAGLRRFLGKTHWDRQGVPVTMPSPMLDEGQAAEVAAYILSLRRKR